MVNSVLTILNYSSLLDFFTPLKRVLQILESEFKTTTKLKEKLLEEHYFLTKGLRLNIWQLTWMHLLL